MADELIFSGLGPGGRQSPRSYTRAEIAAARRHGFVRGKESLGTLGGPLYWAAGDAYPRDIRQAAADYVLLATAVEREWGREWK